MHPIRRVVEKGGLHDLGNDRSYRSYAGSEVVHPEPFQPGSRAFLSSLGSDVGESMKALDGFPHRPAYRRIDAHLVNVRTTAGAAAANAAAAVTKPIESVQKILGLRRYEYCDVTVLAHSLRRSDANI